MFMAGFFISPTLAWIGVLLFSLTVVFALVTLPVEFDASSRAKKLLSAQGIVIANEIWGEYSSQCRKTICSRKQKI